MMMKPIIFIMLLASSDASDRRGNRSNEATDVPVTPWSVLVSAVPDGAARSREDDAKEQVKEALWRDCSDWPEFITLIQSPGQEHDTSPCSYQLKINRSKADENTPPYYECEYGAWRVTSSGWNRNYYWYPYFDNPQQGLPKVTLTFSNIRNRWEISMQEVTETHQEGIHSWEPYYRYTVHETTYYVDLDPENSYCPPKGGWDMKPKSGRKGKQIDLVYSSTIKFTSGLGNYGFYMVAFPKKEHVVVTALLEGKPFAKENGVRINQCVLQVGDHETRGKTSDEVVELIKMAAGCDDNPVDIIFGATAQPVELLD